MLFILKIIIIYIIFNLLNIDILKGIPLVLPILLAVAFFTIFERKILASMQRRRGPNVVGLYGLLQAIADALKLLSKETLIPSSSNIYIFIISPIFTFIISMLC
jgi:NADH:ubiquinone oxidoreductase subunit H